MRRNATKFLVALMVSLIMFGSQAQAVTATSVADKTINIVAKGAYYTTKYTIKSGWFIIKNTAKGAYVVSKGIYNGGKDAFSSSGKKSVITSTSGSSTCKPNSSYSLPPAPNY